MDRGTLIVWGGANLAGWTTLGVMLAIEGHWLVVQMTSFSQTAGFHLGGAFPVELGAATTGRFLAARVVIALFAAYSIGFFAGRKVFRWHVAMAAIGGVAYVSTALIALEHNVAGSAMVFGLGGSERSWMVPNSAPLVALHDTVILLAIPLAMWVARRAQREGAR